MHSIMPVLKAVDYFEKRLQAPALIAEAAEVAGYSLFHFCRVFNQITGLTPYEYLMRRRLSEAAIDLAKQYLRVLDIAVTYQFSSAEAFAHAFKRMFRAQPNQARRNQVDMRVALKRIEKPYLSFLTETQPETTMVDMAGIVLQGLMTISSTWGLDLDLLAAMLQAETDPNSNTPLWAVINHSMKDGILRPMVFLGYPLGTLADIPRVLVRKELPASRSFRFIWPQETSYQQFLLDYIFTTWAPHQELDVRTLILQGEMTPLGKPHLTALCVQP
jgi:AraC-like DNA-binding protein